MLTTPSSCRYTISSRCVYRVEVSTPFVLVAAPITRFITDLILTKFRLRYSILKKEETDRANVERY